MQEIWRDVELEARQKCMSKIFPAAKSNVKYYDGADRAQSILSGERRGLITARRHLWDLIEPGKR